MKTRILLFSALFGLAASLASPRANAGSIFLQSPTATPVNGFVSDFGEPKQRADNFSLSAAASVQSISWWGSYFANPAVPPPANFALRFFDDLVTPGTPDTAAFYDQPLVGAARVDSGLIDVSGNKVFKFTANLPVATTLLASGNTYFASVVENAVGPAFFWSADSAGGHYVRTADIGAGSTWTDPVSGVNLAFELFDTPAAVPTPSAAFGGLALLGMLVVGHKFKQA